MKIKKSLIWWSMAIAGLTVLSHTGSLCISFSTKKCVSFEDDSFDYDFSDNKLQNWRVAADIENYSTGLLKNGQYYFDVRDPSSVLYTKTVDVIGVNWRDVHYISNTYRLPTRFIGSYIDTEVTYNKTTTVEFETNFKANAIRVWVDNKIIYTDEAQPELEEYHKLMRTESLPSGEKKFKYTFEPGDYNLRLDFVPREVLNRCCRLYMRPNPFP